MTKPTVYVETTVIGHLVGRILADPVVAGRQTATRSWWPIAKSNYRLFYLASLLTNVARAMPMLLRKGYRGWIL